MKRSTVINAVLLAGFTILIVKSAANAQLFPYTGTTTVMSSTVMATASTSSAQATTATITTSSTSNAPSSSSPLPVPVVEPTVVPVVQAISAPATSGDTQFNDLTIENISSSSTLPAIIMAGSNTMGSGTSTYTITVDASTELILNDRTSAVLANFTPGDMINVYGYYDGAGDMNAQIVRDLSKPVLGTAAPSVTLTQLETEITQIQSVITQILEQINQLMTTSSSISTN